MPSSNPPKALANRPPRMNLHQLRLLPTTHRTMLSKEAWEDSVGLAEWADLEVWVDSEAWAEWVEWAVWAEWVEWTHK